MAWIAAAELVGVGHDRLDGPTGGPGEVVARVLVDRQTFAAEVSADEHAVHHETLRGQPGHYREGLSQREWRLVGGVDVGHILLVDPHEARMRLDVTLVLPRL